MLISVADQDKPSLLEIAKKFAELTSISRLPRAPVISLLKTASPASAINKLYEGRPNIADAILNKEIQLVVNTPVGKQSQYDDSYIRKTAIKHKIPYITTITAALASVKGIAAYRADHVKEDKVKSLQDYHNDIK